MLKRKKIIAIIILLISLSSYLLFAATNALKDEKRILENRKIIYSKCQEIIKNNDNNTDDYESCNNFISEYNEEKLSFFSVFSSTTIDYVNHLALIMIIIVNVFGIIWINKVLKNKYILNYYTRCSSKNFIKTLIKESYVYILPIILSFMICIVYIYSNTTLEMTQLSINNSFWSISWMNHPYLFIILYLLQLSLFLGTYINLGLIMSRRNYNYILSLISTYLLFLGIQLIDEIILGKIFKLKYSLSIANCFIFDDSYGITLPLIFPIVLFLITFIIVILIYNNKEKLYLDCEKNN
ncbi:MAG: hypothetical protein IJY87_05985 [Bacilli bacterium]|nr:hypothetical protein [Bacilli bacterium]